MNDKRGKLLARGYGIYYMIDLCYIKKWDESNTILKVENSNDVESEWFIYELVKEEK